MSSGWFVFLIVCCVMLCSGLIVAIAIMRAFWAQKEREALTSSDLRAVEESAVVLIEQLKLQADHAICELDSRCAALTSLLAEADNKLSALEMAATSALNAFPPSEEAQEGSVSGKDMEQVLELAASGLDAASIAKSTGLDCAAVNLVLSLGRMCINPN